MGAFCADHRLVPIKADRARAAKTQSLKKPAPEKGPCSDSQLEAELLPLPTAE